MSGTTWTKFFWADWESDPALRLCTFSAQGLWMRLLCIAAAHDPIGYVAVAGRGLDETSIARMTGGSESEVRDLLGELDRNGVFSRDRQGRIYSRRMVSDARRAAIARKNGKSGGNPNLRKQGTFTPPDNPRDKARLKTQEPEAIIQKEQISDANASSPSLRPEAQPSKAEALLTAQLLTTVQPTKPPGYPPDFEAAWKAYPHVAGRSSKPNALAQWRKLPQDDRMSLTGAVKQFAPKVGAVCGDRGAPDMARWLKDGKHLNWMTGAELAPPTPAFDGPADVRAAVVRVQGEDFARGFLDRCAWRGSPSRVLLAPSSFIADRIRRDAGPILSQLDVRVLQETTA